MTGSHVHHQDRHGPRLLFCRPADSRRWRSRSAVRSSVHQGWPFAAARMSTRTPSFSGRRRRSKLRSRTASGRPAPKTSYRCLLGPGAARKRIAQNPPQGLLRLSANCSQSQGASAQLAYVYFGDEPGWKENSPELPCVKARTKHTHTRSRPVRYWLNRLS